MALIFGHRGLGKVSQTIRGATEDDAARQSIILHLFLFSGYYWYQRPCKVAFTNSKVSQTICGVAVDDAEGGG